jgi:hypothetical protein
MGTIGVALRSWSFATMKSGAAQDSRVGSADGHFTVPTEDDGNDRSCDVIVWLHYGEWSLRGIRASTCTKEITLCMAQQWIILTQIDADFRERIRCEAEFAQQKVLKGILKGKPFQEFSL